MLRFSLLLGVTSILIIALVFSGAAQNWFLMPSAFWSILMSLVVITMAIYYQLDRRAGKESFTMIYLLSVVCKLLGYGTLVAVIIIQDKQGAFANVIFFLGVYLLFTVLEISLLFKKINAPSRA